MRTNLLTQLQSASDRIAPSRTHRNARRRGVLLLVVLSMLVLFMLIGTAFLMSSSQEQKTAKQLSKVMRVGNFATKDLDSGLMQVLRDTENPYSAVRYHSLLRDLYGTDGFLGIIYSPPNPVDLSKPAGQVTRFASGTAGNTAAQLGPTNGQFIDIYVSENAYQNTNASGTIDFSAPYDASTSSLDLQNVLKIDRNVAGQPQPYPLPLTRGYFNGCLLTITSGPAAGSSARIVDYQFGAEITAAISGNPGKTATRLFLFRVMAFQRADGQPLQVNQTPLRAPEIVDLAGQSFMVNGRAFSGTGAGYNPLAVAGQPRLSALQLFPVNSSGGLAQAQIGANASQLYLGGELALLPNSIYFDPSNQSIATGVSLLPGADPFVTPISSSQAQLLNDPRTGRGLTPHFNYQSYAGPGDVNESYDAADFQNMFLALQTVTPRAQGRVVRTDGTFSAVDPVLTPPDPSKFLRLDLEDLPIPSFFRPDLANFWFHRMLNSQWLKTAISDDSQRVLAILQPYDANGNVNPAVGGLSPQIAATITAIKRQSSLRPLHEDNPHFTGSNPLSVPSGLPTTGLSSNGNIAIPYWEAVGPWDVDNDNDGIPDSVWVDLGDPVQEAEDGTRYKRLYAFLIVDLDSRLNVNANGLADDVILPKLAIGYDRNGTPFQDPNAINLAGKANSNFLSKGLGYGPAEISLRPVFPSPWDINGTPVAGNRSELTIPVDSYATLLAGRTKQDGSAVLGKYGYRDVISAQQRVTPGSNYDYTAPGWADVNIAVSPTGDRAQPSLAAQLKFIGYPWAAERSGYFPGASFGPPTAFGTPPDLFSRYSLGLDYFGQPFYEAAWDLNPALQSLPGNQQRPNHLLVKSPYELDLSSTQRRDSSATEFSSPAAAWSATIGPNGTPGQNDDAPFSATDLEKVLRGWDPDIGTLPNRLWDVVDAFDPLALLKFDPYRTTSFANDLLDPTARSIQPPVPNKAATPELMAGAQQLASINRRLVTTDSYDLPVTSSSMPNLAALTFGPDGQPGRARPDGSADPAQTVGATGSDDFQAVMGKDPARATIVDLLQYRVWTEARRYEMRRQNLTEAAVASLNTSDYGKFMTAVYARRDLILRASPNLVSDLLAPEVIAGKKMDLNRPFGDGRDNNDDGVVDDPMEAGDPFLDVKNANDDLTPDGKYELPDGKSKFDYYIDQDGDGQYTRPLDKLWANLSNNGTLAEAIDFDYTNGHGEPVNAVVARLLGLDPTSPNYVPPAVRNLDSQGRQLFARHLYCLMLLLVDDNYIAPWNENDPQVMAWMDAEKAKFTATGVSPVVSPAEVDFIVKRKATCKMIAQWAVNCVDMRDPDVISTPFEYDENPWDGWGVWSDKWNVDITALPAPTPPLATTVADLNTRPSFIPFDGDPATDENKAEVIDWVKVPTNTAANGQPSNINQKKLTVLQDGSSNPVVTHPLNQTRGLVWGAERPELLITETLAFHDRRTEDLQAPKGHNSVQRASETSDPDHYTDKDLDQGLRPRGSAFVELYNPWSPTGQLPAELYSHLDMSTNYKYNPNEQRMGVDLDRLSNYAWDETNGHLTSAPSNVANKIRRSPVWRMIVVEEWPDARSTGDAMVPNTFAELGQYLQNGRRDETMPAGLPGRPYTEPAGYAAVAGKLAAWAAAPVGPPPFVATNPDFDPLFGNDTLQAPAQTTLYGSTFDPVPKQAAPGTNMFTVAYPYIEREFYFTTDHSTSSPNGFGRFDYDFLTDRTKLGVRIPDRTIRVDRTTLAWTQKFLPPTLEGFAPNPTNGSAIAPIMPGRYGVVGSAGTCYTADPSRVIVHTDASSPFFKDNQVYVTSIGRNAISGQSNSNDAQHESSVMQRTVRRIEMRPSPLLMTQPSTITGRIEAQNQQVFVGSNGGNPNDQPGTDLRLVRYNPYSHEIARENELISDHGNVKNIQSSNLNDTQTTTDGSLTARYYPPCVSIPVDGMSVSEPPWGYGPREKDAYKEEQVLYRQKFPSGDPPTLTFMWNNDHKEGFYGTQGGNQSNAQSYDKPFDVDPVLTRTGTTANYRMIHLQRLANPLLPWNPEPLLADGKTANPEYTPGLPINPYLTVDSASVNLTAFDGTSDAEGNIDRQFPGDDIAAKQAIYRPWIDQNDEANKYLNGTFQMHKQAWYFRSQERGAWARMNLLGSNPGANNPITTLPQRVLWAQEPAMVTLLIPPVPAAGLNSNPLLQALVSGREMTLRYDEVPAQIQTDQKIKSNYADMVLEHSLGFGNESMGLIYDAQGAKQPGFPSAQSTTTSQAPTAAAVGAPAPSRFVFTHDPYDSTNRKLTYDVNQAPPNKAPLTVQSTDPWVHWGNRPFVSAEELLNVPMASQSTMLRQYSTIDPSVLPANRPNPYGLAELGMKTGSAPVNANRFAVMQSSFGQMANMLAATALQVPPVTPVSFVQGVSDVVRDPTTGAPLLANNNVQPYGAPNFYRILDFVQVPSRFVGTDTMLNAETFNDVPGVKDTVGSDIDSNTDPRYNFQPPFNKVSRERDPGKVNLNTVTGRRVQTSSTAVAQIWSEVYDGIMHRIHDANPAAAQLSESGPAWRDVVLSRRGYIQVDALGGSVDKSTTTNLPDTFEFGLNNTFPTVFANPFRASTAGDLVPLPQLMQFGVDATFERVHPRTRGELTDSSNRVSFDPIWGGAPWPTGYTPFNDARDAGLGNDQISYSGLGTIPNNDPTKRDILPLFSDRRTDAAIDTDRNPYMMYQPMTRLGNLVTDHSNVYAIWVTVGYFEVEKAPDWASDEGKIQERLGGDGNVSSTASIAAQALYNRIYPEGYMLGKEVGSDTGDVKRPRGFYIIDRSEPAGFRPGEDLNVEKMIRLRRRIE